MTDAMWHEPVRGGRFPPELFGLSGIEQLRLLIGGRVAPPPIGHLTGMRPTEVGPGNATFIMPITPWLRTPQGPVTGGAIAILADGPLGCAVQTILPPATPYTTSELSINMVRPVPMSGQLVARGRLVHGGRLLALTEVFVTDDTGRLVAHGTSRCVILPTVENVPPVPADLPEVTTEDDDSWTPPYLRPTRGEVLAQEIWDSTSGLDVLRAQVSGELPPPPLHHLLGMMPTRAAEGNCTFSMPTSGWITSPSGLVEGGVTACLADIAIGGAVQTTVPAGTALVPTDLRVQFLRPVPPDGGPLTATAQFVHRGRGIAAARAEIMNRDGKLVALGNGSAVILPGRRADLSDAAISGTS
jgi:uncharacterized protein (TIGR00369 family)